MKILTNINSSWRTHHGALRLFVAAASLTGLALAWAHGDHVTSAHVALGSHWNGEPCAYRQEKSAEPSLGRRTVVRRRHVWVMAGIVALALGHIVLNSAPVHRLVHW